MNETTSSANKIGWMLSALMGGLLVWMLAGCAHHRDQARYRGSYSEPSPQVESSYVGIRAESDFYEPLSPYGRWEVVGSYGRCWIPGRVDSDWRPYCNGNWQRTDAGWYWASDEPWGWATYHYGRWDLSPSFGWYWVPQTQWAPAWVSWHEGGGYVGWAPLYPSARFGHGGSIEVDVRIISPQAFVFVEERHFLSPVRPTTVVVNNTTIINKTVTITKIKVVNKTVINEGPRTTVIEQASGRKVQDVPVRELRHKEEAAIVAKQRTTPSASENKVQTPVRTEAESRDKKASPARASRQAEKPAATATESPPPVTKKDTHQADEQKRAAKLNEERQAQQEKARAMENERGKREVERPAEAQGQKEQKAVEKRAEQQEKHADKSEPKAQPAPEQRGKHEQADSEKARKNAAKDDREKKGEEQEAPPENPAVSPQSSQ
jgi:hypothetical protein